MRRLNPTTSAARMTANLRSMESKIA